MMKLFRKKISFIVGLSLLLIGIGMWFFMPKNGLLDHAVLIASGPESRKDSVSSVPVYEWLSATEVLLFNGNKEGTISVMKKTVLPIGCKSVAESIPVEPFPTPDSVSLLSDRKTLELVYETIKLKDGNIRTNNYTSRFISLANGEKLSDLPGILGGRYRESDDSLWDVDFHVGANARIANFRKGVISYKSLKPLERVNLDSVESESINSNGRMMLIGNLYNTSESEVKCKSIVELNVDDPKSAVQIYSASIPSDSTGFSSFASPDQGSILWMNLSIQTQFPFNYLLFLTSSCKRKQEYSHKWLVSDRYGKGMHVLAEFQLEETPTPKWTPDGKHISFLHNGGLYLIPAK